MMFRMSSDVARARKERVDSLCANVDETPARVSLL